MYVDADDERLAKNIPAGCIVRLSVTGKFFFYLLCWF